MQLTATFDRVGRNHNVPDVTVEGDDADEIAFHLYNYVKSRMLSRDVEVVVNLDEMRGSIYAGMHNGGSFTLQSAAV